MGLIGISDMRGSRSLERASRIFQSIISIGLGVSWTLQDFFGRGTCKKIHTREAHSFSIPTQARHKENAMLHLLLTSGQQGSLCKQHARSTISPASHRRTASRAGSARTCQQPQRIAPSPCVPFSPEVGWPSRFHQSRPPINSLTLKPSRLMFKAPLVDALQPMPSQ